MTYSTIETAPMVTVEVVGVRNFLWILANRLGMALKTAIDSVVRAVGRMVVCVEAAAELNTIRSRRWVRKFPRPDDPKMEDPSTESTSPAWFGFSSPIPVVPMPA